MRRRGGVGLVLMAAWLCAPRQVAAGDDQPPALAAARARMERGECGAAVEELGRYVKAEPKSAYAWAMLGICLSELRRSGEAESALRSSLVLESNQPRTLTQLGWVLYETGRISEAGKLLERALALGKPAAGTYYALAQVRQAQRDYTGCAEAARQALQLAATAPNSYLLGSCLLQAGRLEEAERAVTPFASGPEMLYLLANVKFNQGDHEAAAGLSRQVLQVHPDEVGAEFLLALSLVQLGKYEEAETAYLRLLRPLEQPGQQKAVVSEVVHEAYGQLLLILNRSEEAAQSFSEALKIDPRHVPSLLGRARVFQQSGQPRAAMADAERALALDPESGTAHVLLSQVYLALGMEEKARAMAAWLETKNQSFLKGDPPGK